MPNPIKAFFDRKKAEAKFKMAGPGQKLGDAHQAAAARQQQQEVAAAAAAARGAAASGSRQQPPSAANRQAAEAAMARLKVGAQEDFEKKRSQAVIRAQALKELEKQKQVDAEINKLKDTYGEKPLVELEAPSACPGVFFHCPLIGPEVLPKKEMKEKIRQFLYAQLAEEKGLTACLIIRTFAKDSEKARVGVETLCKYVDNIIEHPDEEKFRKIRRSNKIYQERVALCEGHNFFLEAVGFDLQLIDDQEFWIFSGEVTPGQKEVMLSLREALVASEPITAELDRGLKVLKPTEAAQEFSLPQEFFAISAEEIRREQQAKTDLVEREGILRTKAMREREELKERRRYRYLLVRIRFPDRLVLQGTFSVYEKYHAVHDMVAECLETPLPFVLYDGHRLEVSDYERPLVELRWAPSVLLNFAWHPEVANEVSAQIGPNPRYLKEEVSALVSTE